MRKTNSRWWAVGATLPIAALVLAGCAADTGTDTGGDALTEDPVTLVVQFEVPEDGPDARAWRAKLPWPPSR